LLRIDQKGGKRTLAWLIVLIWTAWRSQSGKVPSVSVATAGGDAGRIQSRKILPVRLTVCLQWFPKFILQELGRRP